MRARVLAVAAMTTLFVAHPASASDPAAAQVLFDEAQVLMRQKNWAEACPKLEESQRLDPGDGTVLHLAACREHEGKIATAWALYSDALAAAKRTKNKERSKMAQDRVDYLGPRLHRLRVKVPTGDRKLLGFKIMRGDTVVGSALWNDPFPIDPGPHVLTATADGHRKWSRSIDIPSTNGETTIDVPVLDADEAPPSKPPPPKEESKHLSIEEATRGDTQRTVGMALGGLGLAGLVVGGVFGGLAFSKESEANDNCTPPEFTQCNRAGVDAGQTSQTFGLVSTLAFLGGGALAVGGAVLYFTAPDHVGVGLSIAPSSIALTGRFW